MLNYADASITTVDGSFSVSDDPINVTDGSEWPAGDFTVKVWDGTDPAILKAVILVGTRTANALSDLTWNFGGHTDVNIADGDYIALNETVRDFENWRYAADPQQKPPDTPNALDDEFNTTTFDTAKWTWRNQGGATAVTGLGRLLLTVPTSATTSNRIIEQTAPATPYSITARMGYATDNANFSSAGLVLLNAASGRFLRWGMGWDNPYKLLATRFTNPTTFSANQDSVLVPPGIVAMGTLRMVDDGTNLLCQLSANGIDWKTIYSEARTAFVNTPDRIGLTGNVENTATESYLSVDWFRVNWTPDYVG